MQHFMNLEEFRSITLHSLQRTSVCIALGWPGEEREITTERWLIVR